MYIILGILFAIYAFFYLIKVWATILMYYKIFIQKAVTFEEALGNTPIKTPLLFHWNSVEVVLFTAIFTYTSIHFFTL